MSMMFNGLAGTLCSKTDSRSQIFNFFTFLFVKIIDVVVLSFDIHGKLWFHDKPPITCQVLCIAEKVFWCHNHKHFTWLTEVTSKLLRYHNALAMVYFETYMFHLIVIVLAYSTIWGVVLLALFQCQCM